MKRTQQGARIGAVALGIVAGCAMAETNPYYLGVTETYTHESNLLRTDSTITPNVRDSHWDTTLLGGIDQPFGRQRFHADATVGYDRFDSQSQFSSTTYGLTAGLDWEAADRFSGKLGYAGTHSLAPFSADLVAPTTSKNELNLQEFSASMNYGLVSLLTLQGILKHNQIDYSDPAFNYLKLHQNSASLGIIYRPGGLLTLGAAWRYTRGEYPYSIGATGVVQPDNFHRNDLDVTAEYVPTGLSTIRARMSYTKESHDFITQRDISGLTGGLSWDYKATSRIMVTSEFVRDTGASAEFLGTSTTAGDVSQLSNILNIRGTYELTSKVSLLASGSYVRRDLVGTVSGSTDVGYDKYGQIKLGVNYAPARNWLLTCAGSREKRGAHSDLSTSYADDTVSCSATFKPQ